MNGLRERGWGELEKGEQQKEGGGDNPAPSPQEPQFLFSPAAPFLFSPGNSGGGHPAARGDDPKVLGLVPEEERGRGKKKSANGETKVKPEKGGAPGGGGKEGKAVVGSSTARGKPEKGFGSRHRLAALEEVERK